MFEGGFEEDADVIEPFGDGVGLSLYGVLIFIEVYEIEGVLGGVYCVVG